MHGYLKSESKIICYLVITEFCTGKVKNWMLSADGVTSVGGGGAVCSVEVFLIFYITINVTAWLSYQREVLDFFSEEMVILLPADNPTPPAGRV